MNLQCQVYRVKRFSRHFFNTVACIFHGKNSRWTRAYVSISLRSPLRVAKAWPRLLSRIPRTLRLWLLHNVCTRAYISIWQLKYIATVVFKYWCKYGVNRIIRYKDMANLWKLERTPLRKGLINTQRCLKYISIWQQKYIATVVFK